MLSDYIQSRVSACSSVQLEPSSYSCHYDDGDGDDDGDDDEKEEEEEKGLRLRASPGDLELWKSLLDFCGSCLLLSSSTTELRADEWCALPFLKGRYISIYLELKGRRFGNCYNRVDKVG